MRKPVLTVGSSALVVLASLTLAGCANPIDQIVQQGTEKAIENAIEGATGNADVDINTGGGASVPADWPSEVPLPDGEVQMSMKVDGAFNVTMLVDASEVEAAIERTKAAGFAEQSTMDAGGVRIIGLANDTWNVGITISEDSESGKTMMMYIVSPV